MSERKKVLVFTAKWIGLKCIEHLLTRFPQDQYVFVVMEPDADLITRYLGEHGQPCFPLSQATLDSLHQQYADGHFDFLLNLWGGHIFKTTTLAKAQHSLNIHPAYLPYCRGRDPIVWAIRYGWPAGVTLHQIAAGVDEGPIIHREEVPYTFPITGAALYEQVAARAWQVFCEQWPRLRSTAWSAIDQPVLPDNRTFRREDLLRDRVLDTQTQPEALDLVRRLLAHDFGDYAAILQHEGKRYSLHCSLQELPE
ncbi:formyltransferase family protein [Leeia aquatica]|uniref:Formyl transferase N-terminal domain-containing protein n=1 Tax=Leeia aquatica TaxID=2725557 RepID=A0A847SAJ2_9NEIS|nr:formyltransferase family protein [Leeia aquatica]NLR75915.1 hypothetical protein [Leeia aquatica]